MPTLNWLTRGKDIRAAASGPYRLLQETSGLSAGGSTNGFTVALNQRLHETAQPPNPCTPPPACRNPALRRQRTARYQHRCRAGFCRRMT